MVRPQCQHFSRLVHDIRQSSLGTLIPNIGHAASSTGCILLYFHRLSSLIQVIQHRTIYKFYLDTLPVHYIHKECVHNSVRLFVAVNKQINDKERVAAAMENPNLLELIDGCIEES